MMHVLQVFEGRVVDSDNRSGGHVITATAGSGANKQTFNYATERVVGNGSFGTVFQATCLETAETVSLLQMKQCWSNLPAIAQLAAHADISLFAKVARLQLCWWRAFLHTVGMLCWHAWLLLTLASVICAGCHQEGAAGQAVQKP
jgi:hypothetical protein